MIFMLHGDDTYRSRQKLRELTEKFLREVDPTGTNLVTLDGATATASDIWAAIAAQSFLARRRCVVVERIGEAKVDVQREVSRFLAAIPDDVIVVFWEGRSAAADAPRRTRNAKRKEQQSSRAGKPATQDAQLLPLLLEHADHVQEFAPLEGRALEQWVRSEMRLRGAEIDAGALRVLVEVVGGDLWRMNQEIEKLTLAALQQPRSSRGARATRDPVQQRDQGAHVTSDLVNALIEPTPQDDIFAFVDALGSGDRAAALRELERTGADPHYLVSMMARQLRLLAATSDLLERGTSVTGLASALGVHPFVARKLTVQARHAPLATWLRLYPRLLDLDRALKSSRAPSQALIELFCLEAAHE